MKIVHLAFNKSYQKKVHLKTGFWWKDVLKKVCCIQKYALEEYVMDWVIYAEKNPFGLGPRKMYFMVECPSLYWYIKLKFYCFCVMVAFKAIILDFANISLPIVGTIVCPHATFSVNLL